MPGLNSFLFLLLILFNISQQIQEGNYTLEFDSKNWSYDSTNKVYYQIGVVYCTNPVDVNYQSLGIFVPEEYLKCSKINEKYDCKINSSGRKAVYSSKNAPLVLPVETPGYSAMKALTSYDYKIISNFISEGIIYIYAGCRGKYTDKGEEYPAGAPWGVADLKSAIRFLRYNSKLIPGDLKKIYSFGMSGGGAQSCLMGITGNSLLFTKYLEENGAALKDANGNEIKDNIKGSQCWCPITNLDTADAAYEWNMGQYYSKDSREEGKFTKQLSFDLAKKYYEYVNKLKLKDPSGNLLTLSELNEGSYYDYLLKIIEESLNNFLTDTEFPYDPSKKGDDDFPASPPPARLTTIYNTSQQYIDSLNSDYSWVTYDNETNKFKIKSVGDFAKHCKSPDKSVGAFDSFNKGQVENSLFGVDGENSTKHFSQIISDLLAENKLNYSQMRNWNESYPEEYKEDLTKIDSIGKTILERVSIYNPMYYLSEYYEGYKKSDVADYFRINTGISQSDTSNVVEMNLYLALLNYKKNVEFTTVWEKQHVKAERTGTAEYNFIRWVNKIEAPKNDISYIKFNCLLIGLLLLIL